MSDAQLYLGIDIGGTNTAFGIVAINGDILYRNSVPTTSYISEAALFEAIKTDCNNNYHIFDWDNIKAIGIGAPSANARTGRIDLSANLKWAMPVPLLKSAQNIFQRPCSISNDAKATTIGEMRYGSAKNLKDYIVITLGTGVGSGIVANGKIIDGYTGLASELGHTILIPNGRQCGCGRKGCLETYTSATGVVNTFHELANTNIINSILSNASTVTAKDITFAAQQNDALALQVLEQTARYLGIALANAAAYTSPQAIILFGGLTQAGDLLLKPLQHYFHNNVLNILQHSVTIMYATLPAADSAILGAAALAMEV